MPLLSDRRIYKQAPVYERNCAINSESITVNYGAAIYKHVNCVSD